MTAWQMIANQAGPSGGPACCIWRRKGMHLADDLKIIEAAEEGESPAEFRKALGLFDSIMIVAGIMVGSGIFIVSAEISRQVGSAGWLLVAWIITGILTVFGALSYGGLAAMMPSAGGV